MRAPRTIRDDVVQGYAFRSRVLVTPDGRQITGVHQGTLDMFKVLLLRKGRLVTYRSIWMLAHGKDPDGSEMMPVLQQNASRLRRLFTDHRLPFRLLAAWTVGYKLIDERKD